MARPKRICHASIASKPATNAHRPKAISVNAKNRVQPFGFFCVTNITPPPKASHN
nr:MAG TPA: hypothetical protein [Caudoviricetes sp.]